MSQLMTSATQDNVPPGYMPDAQGRMVPLSMIKPIDLLRDQTVYSIAMQAKDLNAILAKFKVMAFADLAAFVEASAEQYKVKIGGEKGHVTVHSHDGRFKVVRSMHDQIRFDEQLVAAKELVDACLNEWTETGRDEIKILVNEAFKVNEHGAVRASEVMKLLRFNITDERWQTAMEAIRNSITVMGSKPYIRIYERIGNTDRYEAISLDVSKL